MLELASNVQLAPLCFQGVADCPFVPLSELFEKRLTLNLVKRAASSDDAAGLVLVACNDPFRGDYDGGVEGEEVDRDVDDGNCEPIEMVPSKFKRVHTSVSLVSSFSWWWWQWFQLHPARQRFVGW